MSTTLAACSARNNNDHNSNDTLSPHSYSKQVDTSNKLDDEINMNKTSNIGGLDSVEERIILKFNSQEVIVKMYDNPTSRDFLSKLPLTLTFEDYARTEKVSYLPNKLSTEKAPSGMEPVTGDFTYYAPWGNLAIFYNDFSYSSGLVLLGKIESGIDEFASIRGDFTVKIEKLDNQN
jgi:hypothetical protein